MVMRIAAAAATALLVTIALSSQLAFAAPLVRDRSTPCRALALAGGGDRGAYQAGVFQAFVENAPDQVTYDVVTGISSINTAALCMYKQGDEKAALDFVLGEWLSIVASDIYKNWPLGIAEGFAVKSGLFSTAPLDAYLHSKVNVTETLASGRKCVVGATSLTRDAYTQFDSTNANWLTALRASSAVPGVFEAVTIGDETFVDGGAEYMTPVSDALAKCAEVSDNLSIDVILCIGLQLPDANHTWITPEVFLRTATLEAQNILMKNAQSASVAFPNAKIRLVFPSKVLPGYFLTFKPEYAEEMIKVGYTDGINALKADGTLPEGFEAVELDLSRFRK
ncbi:hypothetical protein CAOG_005575 [Capsaspora owczarzaki ATCC 30864]|uniref:PNPLA domain-containing protein n=1 Tax=Capsaspora owczarzaki (strain ATCC 30864) TaxID=595528 RepID=A0A0D2WTQ4_CAPO3|nr:hypothetical protein CAOG_005575 [Capsaspora owczarzaki ATCC 30864]